MSEEYGGEGMLDMYLYENSQLLERMEAATLNQKDESGFDEATVNEFFRIMHTIKGSSGIMMFDDITKIAHKLEDVFFYIRETKPEKIPQMELVECILDVTDFISREFNTLREGGTPEGDSTALVDKTDAFLQKMKAYCQTEGELLQREPEGPDCFYIAPANMTKTRYYAISVFYRQDTEMVNIRAYTASYGLKEIAQDLFFKPDDIMTNEESGAQILAEGFHMLLKTLSEKEEIEKLIDASGVDKIIIDEIDAAVFAKGFAHPEPIPIIDLDSSVEAIEEKGAKGIDESRRLKPGDYVIKSKEPGKPKQLAKNTKPQAGQQYISVNVKKMDLLLDLIGEIVIAQSTVLQNPDLKVPGLSLNNFQKAASQLTKVTGEMQDVIMSMRMVPLTATFQKMNRIVFDVSRSLDKEVELELVGEQTELDKNMIEHISDPLMHMIRNSVDHGIESVEERIAVGKPEKGTIRLEARSEGGKVLITVKDDGKGLNADRIYEKAKANGLIGEKCRSDFTKQELYRMITYPGFSTKNEVTELSGRGVGMDVVVRNIQEIGGSLDIDSVEGQGSSMTMKLPLTLAIIDGIVMEVGKSIFVIETGAIKEFLNVKAKDIVTEPDGEEYVMVRGVCYPFVRLGKKYEMEGHAQDIENGIMILASHEKQTIGIFIDKLIGQQEIVVKPIPSYIKKVKGISGCTQLGDGNIALIVDVGGLF